MAPRLHDHLAERSPANTCGAAGLSRGRNHQLAKDGVDQYTTGIIADQMQPYAAGGTAAPQAAQAAAAWRQRGGGFGDDAGQLLAPAPLCAPMRQAA